MEGRGEARILNSVAEYRHAPKAVPAHGVEGDVVVVWEGGVGKGEVGKGRCCQSNADLAERWLWLDTHLWFILGRYAHVDA